MWEFMSHPLVGILAGSVVTWFFAWLYYKRAGDELRTEAQAVHMCTAAILYYMEHPDAKIEVQRDDRGRAVGLIVRAEGHAAAMKFTLRGPLSAS